MSILRIRNKETGEFEDIPVIQGKSAYQSAKDNGFEGTEAEWIESLEGKSGVWTSSEEPPEGYVVQIDPDGDADDVNYTLSDDDKIDITNRVINNIEPTYDELANRVGILENAVANYSKLQVKKVSSLEEMINPDVIYLLPSEGASYYDEYLVFNGLPELIGSTEIDLTNYVTKDYLKDNTKLYRHNIFLYYRDVAPNLYTAGDGMVQASFTLINNDKNSYSFEHNNGSSPALTTMLAGNAWQLIRLYQALALTTNRDDEEMARPCSGICLLPHGSGSSRTLLTCPNILIGTNYTPKPSGTTTEDITKLQRFIIISSYSTDASKLVGGSFKILCGHPTFNISDDETSLWKTKEEFEGSEYNLVDSSNNSYSTYFPQHTLYCKDRVEEISCVTIE